MNAIEKNLFDLKNESIKYTTIKTIPNIDSSTIIGVSIPKIRDLAKKIKSENYIHSFLKELPHKYFEENILHGILLPLIYTDINDLLVNLNNFLPYIDNWAITDTIHPKLFKKYPEVVYSQLKKWLTNKHEYTKRFAIVSFLQYFLDDNFKPEILDLLSTIKGDYYVNMAVAWFYSVALVKRYDLTIKYFENKKLDKWIHNKALQKAIESFRIDESKKQYLRGLKYVKTN